jgi:hypothetical protein
MMRQATIEWMLPLLKMQQNHARSGSGNEAQTYENRW